MTVADDGTASGVLRIFIMTQLDMRSTLPTGKQRTADELTLNTQSWTHHTVYYKLGTR